MDVEGIRPGTRFTEAIENAVGACDVFLAVIGRSWLDSRDREGKRRLDDPQDMIRLETRSALARNVRVIPVLVEGVSMPRKDDLPDVLGELTERQAIDLRDTNWNNDIQALIARLEPGAKPSPAAGWQTRVVMAISALLAAVAIFLHFQFDRGDGWFTGYIVAATVMVVSFWLVLENVKGPGQRTGILTLAAAFVVVAIIVVAWDYFSGGIAPPQNQYFPYAVASLAWVLSTFFTIFRCADKNNRVFVFNVWVVMTLLMLTARLAWQILALMGRN